MSVEIIGLVYHQAASLLTGPPSIPFDLDYIRDSALAHEASGFDRVLISQNSAIPDPLMLSSYIAGITTKLNFMVAHRPGFMAPTMAARAFATLDQLSGGRASVHIISGASDAEMLRDGDRLTKEQRYRRSREYLTIMRKMWSSEAPFDHEGAFYRLSQAFSMVKPTRPSGLTVSWAGSSAAALETAGECADIYAMIGDGPDVARENARLVSAEAERHGRKIGFAITFCVIIGDTEAQAWARAHEILDRISARFAAVKAAPPPKSASAEIERVLRRSLETDRIGKTIWLAINNATRMATGNNTTIVGTVEQVAETLMLYHDIGFRSFLVRGFDPLEDAKAFGKALIPAIRAEAARRDARAVA